MSDKTLKQWAFDQNIEYWTAWRQYKKGDVPNAYETASGRIFVKEMIAPQQITQSIATSNIAENKIPTIEYSNISMAAVTRSNKSADSDIVNRFANIDAGIIPYISSTSGGYNRSGINVKDTIILCQKAYFNIAIFRQIIDLIVDLSIGEIFLRGGNKKSRDFIKAYLQKIELESFQTQFFLELWRSSNVIIFSYNKDIKSEDIKKITNIYGLQESTAAKKINLPVRFTILNPADIQVSNACMFVSPNYVKVLNGYELERLKNPKTDADQDVLNSLPPEARKQIENKTSTTISLQLPAEHVLASFYKKMDYEGLAIPVFFPVLDDLNWKLQLKKMDIATTRMMNQAILLITTGAEPEKGGINYNNISNLQAIFQNESVGRVLVADYTTQANFLIPDISSILDAKKYEVVNNDIYIGLNYILLQGEKFANKQTALQLFIEKINYGRKLFINDFLNKVIEKVCKELGFKNYPQAYFEEVKISDKTERDRIITQLAQYGHLTPKEVFEALDNGKMPLPDESLENQVEFKAQRDKGYYQPLTGGPANQMDLLKETNKQATKLQENQHLHDQKENSRQRKHEAENPPPAPPPSIHIGAPVKTLKKSAGRPAGTKRKQSTKKVGKIGASLISGTKVIENTLLFDKLNKEIINTVLDKYKLKSLNSEQIALAEDLGKKIIQNEEPENWLVSINKYIEKPQDINKDRISKIESLAYEHQLQGELAAIVFASIKEDVNDDDAQNIDDNREDTDIIDTEDVDNLEQ